MLSSMFGTRPPRQAERRIDPEDGKLRTLHELQVLCENRYSDQEIREYWNRQCKPVGDLESPGSDAFQTRAPGRTGSQSGRTTGLQVQGANTGARDQMMQAASQAAKHWTEAVTKLLGPGDPDRTRPSRNVLALVPWLIFMWLVLVWLLLQHYSTDGCRILTALMAFGSFAMIAFSLVGKRWGPVSLLSLGVLCLLATGFGTLTGLVGWDRFWRQYWWIQTGARTESNSATTPAGSQVDSSVIGFWNDRTQRTVNGSYVDEMRSAGYKDGHFYCVAPILNPWTAEGTLMRVNYWAIGIDCCQQQGSFVCDDARRWNGGYGVVMLDGGMPCPGCNADAFRNAVSKAESVHGLVSAPGALMVRWVQRPSSVESGILIKSVFFIFLSGFVSFWAFILAGLLVWYYGIGKRPLLSGFLEGFTDGARAKLVQ